MPVQIFSRLRMPKANKNTFPIVGIGASAGGLEAFEQFFRNVPENTGMAYVVIQHLDPNHKGMLPELLQRVSKLEVLQAKNRMKVKPDCVYVIPPNKSMSILNGTLHLIAPVESRGLRLPIDFFFLSLAEDKGALGVGIILSGMGSDGTTGLQAIKEKRGIAMVQDPSTAKFDSMPRHAIDSVNIDMVAPPKELPARLMQIFKSNLGKPEAFALDHKDHRALDNIVSLLRIQTGNDFSLYKKNTMYRRIERRVSVHKLDNIASYVGFLQKNPKELDILFKELLIGVTSFFRDAEVWEKLENKFFPEILAKQPDMSTLRAWVPGCSTGEEAYTLAMVFTEARKRLNPAKSITFQLFASDLDNEAIEIARKGQFPKEVAADIPLKFLNRYFVKTAVGYDIIPEIREMVVFAQHNLIMHPPFINIDVVSCRNLLIYLDSELQKKIVGLFNYALNMDGMLILGTSETTGSLNHLFDPLDGKLKIYRRSVANEKPGLQRFPSAFSDKKDRMPERHLTNIPASNIQTLADQIILQEFAPAGVLVNESGDILYISGRTGKFLEPASGKANMNIFAMLHDGLRPEFSYAFSQVIRKKESVVLRNLKSDVNGKSIPVDMHIQYIGKPETLKGHVLVVFAERRDPPGVGKPAKPSKGTEKNVSAREAELEKKLQQSLEEMQSTIEEMQTTQEELKSTNEELQSANEELQSANEELTSSKEEMQSLNEELQTLNVELQVKVDEFTRVDNDMKNLLNSTDIATLFLDKELNIRRFTNQATAIFKFIKSDIGRPFTDQVSDLNYPEMARDAKEVLQTLVFVQKQIPSKDGRWFSVRIMPYRTYDDRIEGLVITFINITELKEAEEKLKLLSNE
jgi:two-component system, chemotaxis family, CheB/CheR fusion protein